ncbi:hypothetical protein QBC38DRAFT_516973 [Podospora fimiseda]|uniref:DUF7580 domain-containing protein n=1 Tax=Podospora fimiseda TaxID=252190 RepID=A0AAN7BWI7_9PEZI|nr:hypothetical protein QBC38DRAFT_516973 [Podospora fimiseda]
MSGFEIAGVVLGAIPLVISALEHYQTGKGTLASFLKYGGLLEDLIFRLKLQQDLYSIDIFTLLQELGVIEPGPMDKANIDECIMLLRDPNTKDEIEQYFGILYGSVLQLVGRYETCLKTIIKHIKNIQRLPNTKNDDLESLINANQTANGRFAFPERMSFTIKRATLKALLTDLQDNRLSLGTIIDKRRGLQETAIREPSREAAKLVSKLTQLESRVPLNRQQRKAGWKLRNQTKFDLMIPLQTHPSRPILYGFSIHAVPVFAAYGCPANSRTSNTVSAVQPATVTFKFTAAQNNPDPTQARSDLDLRSTTLCEIARESYNKGCVLKLKLTTDILAIAPDLPSGSDSEHTFSTEEQGATLQTILEQGRLDEDDQLTPKHRTILALDIAASILQLQQTTWLTVPWNSKLIRLIASRGTPFIEQTILLLEIWNHRPLESWIAKTNQASLNVDTADGRLIAAIRWFQSSSERLPPHYRMAVEKCLTISSGRRQEWADKEFQKSYVENVIKPLLETCKAWNG